MSTLGDHFFFVQYESNQGNMKHSVSTEEPVFILPYPSKYRNESPGIDQTTQ